MSSNTGKLKKAKKEEIDELCRVVSLKGNPRAFLTAVINNRTCCLLFREFLHSIYCAENLSCYIQIQLFKITSDVSKQKEMIKSIYHTYVRNNSPQQVNLTAAAKVTLIETLKAVEQGTEPITPNLFGEVERQLQQLMERDSIPKFSQSRIFNEFVAQLEKKMVQVHEDKQYFERTKTLKDFSEFHENREKEEQIRQTQVAAAISEWETIDKITEYDLGSDRVVAMCQLDENVYLSLSGGSLGAFVPAVDGTHKYISILKSQKCESFHVAVPYPENNEIIFVSEGGLVLSCDVETMKVKEITRIKTDIESSRMYSAGIMGKGEEVLICDTVGTFASLSRNTGDFVVLSELNDLLLCLISVEDYVWLGGMGKIYILKMGAPGENKLVFETHDSKKGISDLLYLPALHQVWAGCEDGTIEIIDSVSHRRLAMLSEHANLMSRVKCLTSDMNGKIVYSADTQGNVIAWHAEFQVVLQTLSFPKQEMIRSLMWLNGLLWIGFRMNEVYVLGPKKKNKKQKKAFTIASTAAPKTNSKRVHSSRISKIYLEEKRNKGGDYNIQNHLLHSCVAGDLEMVQYMIEVCSADPHYVLQEGESSSSLLSSGDTALSVAKRYDSLDVIKYLGSLEEEE
mmetsp:Transcript_33906/g.46434  ORF Transcript_33906/g.46434 Transcript_33906/m.46434 type:complete len:626 (+) Transcript_33906:48-1925(+)